MLKFEILTYGWIQASRVSQSRREDQVRGCRLGPDNYRVGQASREGQAIGWIRASRVGQAIRESRVNGWGQASRIGQASTGPWARWVVEVGQIEWARLIVERVRWVVGAKQVQRVSEQRRSGEWSLTGQGHASRANQAVWEGHVSGWGRE